MFLWKRGRPHSEFRVPKDGSSHMGRYTHHIELFKRLRKPAAPYWVTGGNHNQLDQQGEFVERLKEFLADLALWEDLSSIGILWITGK